MIRKIILENYMAHVHTVIQPVAGLTVLIGPNNCGKSAVIHALEMICYNSDAAGFAIRHGAKKATVTIETVDDDGTVHTLIWWRKKHTAGYIIDGREISGLGRGKIPDDLHQFLRMPEIPSATGNPFRIHFGLQKSPIFLLDDPESRAAQFFASSSDADRLMEMQRRHTQKVLIARRDKERLDREIETLDSQLSVLAPLPEISNQLVHLEAAFAQLNAMEIQLVALARCIESLERATTREQICQTRVNALVSLRSMPALHELAPLKNHVRAMGEVWHRTATNRARQQVLIELNGLPFVPETSGLVRLIRELQSARKRFDSDRKKVESLDPLREAPEQHDTVGLTKRIAAIESVQKRQNRSENCAAALLKLQTVLELKNAPALSQAIGQIEKLTEYVRQQLRRSDALANLPSPPDWVDLAPMRKRMAALALASEKTNRFEARHRLLQTLPGQPSEINLQPMQEILASIEKSVASVDRAQKSVHDAERKLSQLRAQIEHWVEQNPQCQTCGQDINAELIVAGAVVGVGGHAHE